MGRGRPKKENGYKLKPRNFSTISIKMPIFEKLRRYKKEKGSETYTDAISKLMKLAREAKP